MGKPLSSILILSSVGLLAMAGWVLFIPSGKQDDEEKKIRVTTVKRTPKRHSHTSIDHTPSVFPQDPVAEPKKPYKRVARRFGGIESRILNQGQPAGNSSPQVANVSSFEAEVVLDNILTEEKGLSVRDRVKQLKELHLTHEVSRDLLAFIESGKIPEGIREGSYHWMVDEIFTTVRDQMGEWEHYTQTLKNIAQNSEADLVVRDYAMQHLGHTVREGRTNKNVQESLRTGLSEKEGTLAGTSLLALQDIENESDLIDRAMQIAKDSNYSNASRVTALQMAARNRTEELLGLARSIIESEEASAHLKAVASSILSTKKNQQ